MKNNKIYNGNVEITKTNQSEWEHTLEGTEKISGDLRVYGQATLPALTEVGGDLLVYEQATLPKRKPANKPKPIRDVFAKHGYLLADGILARIISKRKSGQTITYKTNRIGNRRYEKNCTLHRVKKPKYRKIRAWGYIIYTLKSANHFQLKWFDSPPQTITIAERFMKERRDEM